LYTDQQHPIPIMKKKRPFRRKIKIVLLFITGCWLIAAQYVLQFRISDQKAHRLFTQHGVELITAFYQTNGHHLHYAKTGNDSLPTLVFIHGSPGSWSAFSEYLYDTSLLHHFRLIAIDRPGFGYSDFGNTMNLAGQSGIISSFLLTIQNGSPMHLVGHSLGGPLIVKLAADHPEMVSSLVILAGAIDPSLENKEYWRPVITYSPLRWLVPTSLRYSNEELWYLKKDLRKLKDEIGKVHCPVMLVHGEKDRLVPVQNIDYGKKMMTGALNIATLRFPGEDHFIVWTKFAEIKQLLLKLSKN
jgi:pimeloyl-ACP methyl ester carboxylesterase